MSLCPARQPALPVTVWVLALAAWALCGCAPADRTENVVRVTGASTVYPIVVMAGEVLHAEGGVEVRAQAGGSTRGFEDTLAGRNDLGAMARDPTPEEAAQVLSFPIALDGVGIVVHGDNPVPALTTEDLRRIYREEVTLWSDFGGTVAGGDGDDEIVVVTKAEGHATLQSFLDHTGLDREELKVDVVAGDNAQVIRVVTNTPGAIGYVSMGETQLSIDAGMPLRLVRLDGVEPTREAVSAGTYPMKRTLYLVSKEEPTGASLKLLDFLRGEEGRAVIERGGYVPLDR